MSVYERLEQVEINQQAITERFEQFLDKLKVEQVFAVFKERIDFIMDRINELQELVNVSGWPQELKAINDRIQDILEIRNPENLYHQVSELQDYVQAHAASITQIKHELTGFIEGKVLNIYTNDDLKGLYANCKLTYEQIGQRIGYSSSQISRIICGDVKDAVTRAKVAETMISIIRESENA